MALDKLCMAARLGGNDFGVDETRTPGLSAIACYYSRIESNVSSLRRGGKILTEEAASIVNIFIPHCEGINILPKFL